MLAPTTEQRHKTHFPSGDTTCAAWHYPGTGGACVILAAGLAVTKEAGTDRFATAFNEAGFSVLAFDYRRLGESGGRPRQVVRISEQLADWDAALAFARTLPEVDPSRIAIWGFSLSGGHVLNVAADHDDVAAVIAHSALIDGQAAAPNAARHTTPAAMARLTAKALADTVRLRLGRDPLLVPLTGERGAVAAITTPDSRNGPNALNPGNQHPEWRQEVAASSALRIGL